MEYTSSTVTINSQIILKIIYTLEQIKQKIINEQSSYNNYIDCISKLNNYEIQIQLNQLIHFLINIISTNIEFQENIIDINSSKSFNTNLLNSNLQIEKQIDLFFHNEINHSDGDIIIEINDEFNREIVEQEENIKTEVINDNAIMLNNQKINYDNKLSPYVQIERPFYNDSQSHRNILKIERIINMENLHSDYITCLVGLNDKRIATASWDSSITISSFNIYENQWKIDIHQQKAHEQCILSLCVLNYNRLVSCGRDTTIKIWFILDSKLSILKTLNIHKNIIYKIIPLSKQRFASCSRDETIIIWKDNCYDVITTLNHGGIVNSIIQLNQKEILVACGDPRSGLSFWNTNNYSKKIHFQGYGTILPTGMIELSDGNIALSSNSRANGYPIVIINTITYKVVKKIQFEGYITGSSSLCLLNDYSFIYIDKNNVVQISTKDFTIMSKSQKSGFVGNCGIVIIETGVFLAIGDSSNSVSIVKVHYA